MRQCPNCKRRWPLVMFARAAAGFKTVTGRAYACRLCNFNNPTRYAAHPGPMGRKLEPYQVSLWRRIKEFFRA